MYSTHLPPTVTKEHIKFESRTCHQNLHLTCTGWALTTQWIADAETSKAHKKNTDVVVNLPISWALELNLRHQLATKTVPVSSVIQFLQMQYYFLLLQLLSGNINFLLPTTDRISIGVMGISTGPRPETNVNAMICCVDRMAISRVHPSQPYFLCCDAM